MKKHKPITIYPTATKDCITNNHVIREDYSKPEGKICYCAKPEQLCKICHTPWPCDFIN